MAFWKVSVSEPGSVLTFVSLTPENILSKRSRDVLILSLFKETDEENRDEHDRE